MPHSFTMADGGVVVESRSGSVGRAGYVRLPLRDIEPSGSDYDVCGRYESGYGPVRSDPFYRVGVCYRDNVDNSKYMLQVKRMESFKGWPKEAVISGEKLADAGFYWTGTSDLVMCFWCGGGLEDWEEDEDAWVSHSKWFPKCCYVMEVKGMEFVQNVKLQVRVFIIY